MGFSKGKRANRPEGFNAACVRLLTSREPPLQADYGIAKELIDAGHAAGAYRQSHAPQTYGEVLSLARFVPTLQGRLFADELAQAARQQTWRYRLTRWALTAASAAAGWVGGVSSDSAKAALKQWVGF